MRKFNTTNMKMLFKNKMVVKLSSQLKRDLMEKYILQGSKLHLTMICQSHDILRQPMLNLPYAHLYLLKLSHYSPCDIIVNFVFSLFPCWRKTIGAHIFLKKNIYQVVFSPLHHRTIVRYDKILTFYNIDALHCDWMNDQQSVKILLCSSTIIRQNETLTYFQKLFSKKALTNTTKDYHSMNRHTK